LPVLILGNALGAEGETGDQAQQAGFADAGGTEQTGCPTDRQD